MLRSIVFAFALILTSPIVGNPLTKEQKFAIDSAVTRILQANDVPSASIAVVTDGRLDYAKAYGDQRLDGTAPAASARYPIASISKQFTAASILLLAEDGKLSLDDKVARYLPAVTGADSITIRELLGHTSGIRDYWPQDFSFEAMAQPTMPRAILDHWGTAPLDFAPGSKWQYSNTGYTAAGLIVELVANESLQSFEQGHLFRPLGMNVVLAATGLSADDAAGTTRYALGPVRPVPGEGAGWTFAAADLAMSASELAKWNIARLERSILKPESWQAQETNVAPGDANVEYGLGVVVDAAGPHRRIQHGGGLTGYHSSNRVYPADHAAITVLINAGFSRSHEAIADAIEDILFNASDEVDGIRQVFDMLRAGRIDRSKFTENGNFYFTSTVLSDYRSSLATLGALLSVARYRPTDARGGLTYEQYILTFPERELLCVVRADEATGRFEQFTLYPFTE